jgi:subtilase family serine protease
VTLHTFRLSDGMRFRSNVTTARLPRAVASVTSAVVGLSDLGRLQLPNQNRGAHPAASISIGGSYGPQNFWSLYDAPAGITGAGQSLAIITAFDVAQAQADLPKFEAHFGLPHVPFSVVQVGPKGTPDAVASQEWDLDSQYATGFAPGASQLIAYMGTSLLNTDILATISRWVTDDATRQGSFSGGECESLAAENGFTAALNPVLQRAAAQGQSLFVASGDAGSQCPYPIGLNGVPIGIPGVEFPAASPYAIGVGGTTIYATAPTKEIAWYAGGGGIGLDKAPVWQQTVGGTFVNAGGRRGVPDVALDADPESGYICVFNGAVTPGVGGTSASAPSWQGIWARAESAHGGAVGFAGPVLYRIAANSFRDVKAGTNGLYAAAPGYDYTTGRGTPDITRIVSRA